MRQDLPETLQQTSHDLTPDALVTLFKIVLNNKTTTFFLSPTKEVTWQGDLYEQVPCHMTGIGQNSDAQVNRPKFSFANPEGLFTPHIYQGRMDNALITRIRILKSDLDNDYDFAVRETFRVSKVAQLGQQIGVLELRDIMDSHRFTLPARQYLPPEFPHVRLQ